MPTQAMFRACRWLLLALALKPAAAGPKAVPPVVEDLGPSVIDVSSYPEEHRKTYQDIFVPVFGLLGGTARAVNSPIIELDGHREEQERRDNPELFANPDIAVVSRDGWKKRVEEIYHRPACCGACPTLTREKAKALWRFLVYDSIRRKTGRQARGWSLFRGDLTRRFEAGHYIAKENGK